MGTKDRDDIFHEITSRVSEVNRCIEGLERKITEMGLKKKDLEDMRRGLDEISIRFYHVDHDSDSPCPKKEEDDLNKRLNELISEFDSLKDGIDLGLEEVNDEKKQKKLDDSAQEEVHESKKIKLGI